MIACALTRRSAHVRRVDSGALPLQIAHNVLATVIDVDDECADVRGASCLVDGMNSIHSVCVALRVLESHAICQNSHDRLVAILLVFESHDRTDWLCTYKLVCKRLRVVSTLADEAVVHVKLERIIRSNVNHTLRVITCREDLDEIKVRAGVLDCGDRQRVGASEQLNLREDLAPFVPRTRDRATSTSNLSEWFHQAEATADCL